MSTPPKSSPKSSPARSAPAPLELDPIMGAAALAEHNAALVPYVSRKFFPNLDLDTRDEIEGAGYLELMNAARRFDPSRGRRFSTYATTCIYGAMRNALARERAGLFGNPSVVGGRIRLADLPTTLPLDVPQTGAGTPDARTLADILPDTAAPDPEAVTIRHEDSVEFWQRFERAGLTDREVAVVACCYGFDEEDKVGTSAPPSVWTSPPVVCPPGCFLINGHTGKNHTPKAEESATVPKAARGGLAVSFTDAGYKLGGVSRESIRQVHVRAIDRLKRAMLPA